MSKKYLTKNEFRMDNNPKHFGQAGEPHPAYISVKYKHRYKANDITHSRTTTNGEINFNINENPNKSNRKSEDKRKIRISPPFWQKEELFGKEKLSNMRFSNTTRKKIKKSIRNFYNKKFNPCSVTAFCSPFGLG